MGWKISGVKERLTREKNAHGSMSCHVDIVNKWGQKTNSYTVPPIFNEYWAFRYPNISLRGQHSTTKWKGAISDDWCYYSWAQVAVP